MPVPNATTRFSLTYALVMVVRQSLTMLPVMRCVFFPLPENGLVTEA